MKQFKCLVANKDGSTQKTTFTALTLEEVKSKLEAGNLSLLKILDISEDEGTRVKLSSKDQLIFFETLSTLLSSGLSVQQAMDIISTLNNTAEAQKVALKIKNDLTKGISFHTALSEAISNLPKLILGMVKIGEKIGFLDSVLVHLLNYMQLMKNMKGKIASASLYPILILSMTIIGVLALVIFFIPQLEQNFTGSTALYESIHKGIFNLRIMLVLVAILVTSPLVIFFLYKYGKATNKNYIVHIERFLIKIPLIGNLIEATQLLTLSYSMEVMAQANVQLDESLILSADGVWSQVIKNSLLQAVIEIKNGAHLSTALQKQKFFPEYFIRWIQISEQTGKINQVFSQLRKYYEKELEKIITRFMAMIEPILIALIGIVLLSVIVMIVLPLFNIYGIAKV